MKRLLLVALVCGFVTVPSLGVSSLGFWEEGDEGTIHMLWNLGSSTVLEVLPGKSLVVDASEAAAFPPGLVRNPIGGAMVIGQNSTYDAQGGSFSSPDPMGVHLTMNRLDRQTPYEEVWVDFVASGVAEPTGVLVTEQGVVTFSYELLCGPGPGTEADFGWRIRPDPWFEEVVPTIHPASDGLQAILDSIHVDTISNPTPGALLLASLGVVAVGWLRTRRGL